MTEPLSNIAFHFNLRCYSEAVGTATISFSGSNVVATTAAVTVSATIVPVKYLLGRAVQVDPVKSEWKPPGIERLKLNYDPLPSTFAFVFNLRHYI